MNSYVKDYPRPQLVRADWTSLNGIWDFAFDDENAGLKRHWERNFPAGKTIRVPFAYESPASGIGDGGQHRVVWYRRAIAVAEPARARRLLIHFEGCDYQTTLFVNGREAGSHTGGYTRFTFDLTDHVSAGENTLTVRVEDRSSAEQSLGKQRWIDQNFGCWYVQTTGIWKTVWLEEVPELFIRSLKLTPDLAGQSIGVAVELGGDDVEGLSIAATASFSGSVAGAAETGVRDGGASVSVPLRSTGIDPWGVKTWTPQAPNLYDLRVVLKRGGVVVDEALSYFGMREIRIEGRNVLLNGSPLYQRLILDQGYWKETHLTPPSEEALIEDVEFVKEMGYNGLRKHQKIEDERFYYWCDVKGLLVWCESPSAYSFTGKAVGEFTSQWIEILNQHYNHPSIIVWTPFNESWGVPRVKTDSRQQHFTEAVYHLTKAFDPMRPVIANDGWEHTVSDIITLHDYEEAGSAFFQRYSDFFDRILSNEVYHSGHKSAFAEGYAYRGQPILISEYGGIAFDDKNQGWGYGNKVGDEEAFFKRFESITSAIKRLPFVCGFCYTQLTDVQQEINGLLDIDRNDKVDLARIKEINLKEEGLHKQR